MKSIYFDCFSGASGDMIVGALIDAGADFEALRAALATLGVQGYALRAEKIMKKGIRATQFYVDVDESTPQPHRHLRHVLEIIHAGVLPESVKAAAEHTFQRIAEAEASVHGTTIEKVHFHEVGAVDSIMDVVGAHMALHLLGAERITASPLPLGSGTVRCAHGVMPVPVPATALLVQGAPTYGGDTEGELVTPTGAALITDIAQSYGSTPAMRITAVGYGSGARDYPDRANVLRVLIGETDAALEQETIAVLEANVDDMTPELIAPFLVDALKAGARDAFTSPIYGKKGRPGHLLTVLCSEDRVSDMVSLMLHATTTFGVRIHMEQRTCLHREWKTAQTPWGEVRVKIGYLNGAPIRRSPEFEDCRAVAESAGVLVLAVYEAALASAIRGEVYNA